jgi:hypothetical protein
MGVTQAMAKVNRLNLLENEKHQETLADRPEAR